MKSPSEQLKIGIIGGGLAGMITAMDLADAGHKVEIFEARRFAGGKVGSWVDKDGNHIEMGLHVFFGCYYNLFGIMKRLGIFEKSLRLKEHTHSFINKGRLTLGAVVVVVVVVVSNSSNRRTNNETRILALVYKLTIAVHQ